MAANPVFRSSAALSRSERVREENDLIAKQATRLHFVSRVPFICECNDEACREFVLLLIEDYYPARDAPLLAEEHRAL